MTFEVVFSGHAKADLEAIFNYVLAHDGVDRAEALLETLYSTSLRLKELPRRGHLVKELRTTMVVKYREIHYKPYRILYEIRERRVIVHAVLDGRRDLRAFLEQRLNR